MKSRIAALAALAVACAPEIPNTPPGEFVTARFDPSAATPVVPTPNDLVTNPTTGLLTVPVPADASAPDRWFYDWLNTLNGFPTVAGASVTFTHALDPATVTPATVRVIDLDASNADVAVTRTYADSTSTTAPGQITITPPTTGWTPGHRYAIAIVGGVNGVRGKTGLSCVGSATWAFLRNEHELIDCPNDDLASSQCRLKSELVPSSIIEDPARRVADQLATAKRLEGLRRKYKPAVDYFAANGVPRADLALLWTFRIDDSAQFVFDPTASRVPSPNNLAIKQGLIASPIDPGTSQAAQEWTRTWLNTLNGFPATTAAGADIAQQPLDPSTLTERSVRVSVLSGGPLAGPPTIAWNPQLKRLVLTPAGGSWGAARTIAVTVIGGPSGVKGVEGKRLVASSVWSLVRSAAPLVDCEVLAPTCNSFVKAAPITGNQAIALESLRRTYKPLLDGLEAQGIPRRDVVGAWIFSTLDQPELVFDPAGVPARVPTPTDLAINPATGLVSAPVPPAASPAYAEFITSYLNTLDGFPVSSVATAELGGDVDPASVTTNTVRVEVLSGGALSGTPTIAFDADTGRLTVTPPNGSWGKARSIAVAVLGGAVGIRSRTGKPLVASQAFSFARLSNPLVDAACVTVGPSCRSVVSLLSDAQAIGLEPVRRALKPVLDSLETNGLPRQDVAGLWVFRTVSQAEVTFDLSRAVVPFPNNHLLRGNTLPDGGTQSGYVVLLPDGGAPGDDATPGVRLSLPVPAGAPAAQAQLIAGLNTLDGFSTTAPIVSENSATLAALDQGGLDAGSLSGAGLVKLDGASRLLPDGGARAPDVRVCLNCASSLNDAGVLAQPEELQWVPQTPLDDASRYAAYVTTDVRDTRGKRVMAAPTFALVRLRNTLVDGSGASTIPVVSNAQAAQLEPVRRRFQGCLDRLEALGRPRSTLALAFCVTTQSIAGPIRALTAGVNASPVPTGVRWMVDVTTATRASLTTAGVPNAAIGSILEGEVTLPFALTGPGGTFNPNAGQWEARPARFTLTLPAAAAPMNGYPVALYGHGLTRSRGDALLAANALATAGLATLAIDTPFHGDRSDCRGLTTPDDACANPTTQQCSPATGRCVIRPPTTAAPCDPMTNGDEVCFAAAQGRCLATGACEGGQFAQDSMGNTVISGNRFLDLVNLFAIRDNFRHTGAVDLAQVVRAVAATGPGTLDARLTTLARGRLDATQLQYVGQSLGTFNGAVFAAAHPLASRFALNVAGSDQVEVLLTSPGFATQRAGFLANLAASGATPGTPAFDSFVVLARTILDPADPQNLVRHALDANSPNRRLFVPWIEGDAVLPNSGTVKLLRAGLGATNASRLAWFEYLPHAGTPAPGRFPPAWPASARHGFFLSPGGAPGSPTINAECDPTSMSFSSTTCATSHAQAQVAQFLSAGITPANVPVTP